MVAGKEFLKRYVFLVDQMLKAQQAYYNSKTAKGYKDRTLLQKAKDIEAEVKRATNDYYKHRDQLELTFN